MSRIRSLFAVCMLIAIGAMVPLAEAQVATAKAIIAGSSAIWQSAALGAYNSSGVTAKCIAGFTSPCFHYTAKNFQVNDTRPTFKGGTTAVDKNSIWIVWDSHTTTAGASPNFIAYIKVDSVVGDRCYYGQPRCNVTVVGGFPAPGNLITVWPDGSTDSTPPANIQSKFTATTGPLVSAAATDVRAEDGAFAMCRANSKLPTASPGNATQKGLGYNSNNAAGTCPTTNDLAHLTAGDITDVLGSTAHILDFNVSGTDPFSGHAIVAGTTVPAGAAPVIPIAHVGVNGALNNVTDVSDAQLQALFANSGTGCKGTTLGGGAGSIDVYIREPLSGTYNTIEYNAFVYPDFSGTSQEAFLDPTLPNNNPLNHTCPAGGGKRIRGIGTGNVIDNGTVKDTTFDSIAYTFAGWGNWKQASDLGTCTAGSGCRYLTLNGVDGIFHQYVSSPGGTALDPGQPNTTVGQVPASDNLPAACGGNFPCREDQIWKGGLSYPNLRSGQYRAWSILRLISDGAALASVKSMVIASQAYSAVNTPDFVPIVAVVANASTGFKGDPGLQLLRSHYQQVDNAGTLIGPAPVNDSTTGDKGGDVGGCIEHFLPGITANQIAESDSTTGLIHNAPGNGCHFAPTSH
ncbi:MAG TPA: hypothetical protein VKB49_17150 [Candidatus Sulfotelmatobacter sp.]|nr:hypothetical protein [Candidatus Sulfotelmatobacter sp.]